MENNISVNLENLSEEEREQLMKLIQKSNESKRKIWKPEYNGKYYYVSGCDAVSSYRWKNDNSDNGFYRIGNCFKTKEEAELALEKVKVVVELRRFAEENNECVIDWENRDQEKWFLLYDYNSKRLWFNNVFRHKMSNIYFSSKEIAKQAVDYVGEDRLKKYYFEVED